MVPTVSEHEVRNNFVNMLLIEVMVIHDNEDVMKCFVLINTQKKSVNYKLTVVPCLHSRNTLISLLSAATL